MDDRNHQTAMVKRVLIIGGYGNFGARPRMLAADEVEALTGRRRRLRIPAGQSAPDLLRSDASRTSKKTDQIMDNY